MEVEKYYDKNRNVAILFSPNYGAGWYTWNSKYPEIIFDKEIVKAILKGDKKLAEKIAIKKYPDIYTGGVDDLTIFWLSEGLQFEIEEYDGYESVHVIGERNYFTA